MVRVRRYTSADAQACSRLVESAVATMIDANAAARELIRAHAAPGLLDTELAGCHAVVAEDARGIVGMAVLAGAEIRRVYVQADTQRSGVGRALMTALEHEAVSRAYEEVHLTAGAAAASFYERLGYERLEAGEFVDGDARVPFVYMRKRLRGRDAGPAR
jgi:GNAT superfamily N-acetyltransferase